MRLAFCVVAKYGPNVAHDELRNRERGNLTQAGLIEWMSYTLDTCKST